MCSTQPQKHISLWGVRGKFTFHSEENRHELGLAQRLQCWNGGRAGVGMGGGVGACLLCRDCRPSHSPCAASFLGLLPSPLPPLWSITSPLSPSSLQPGPTLSLPLDPPAQWPEETSAQDFRQLLELNLLGTYALTKVRQAQSAAVGVRPSSYRECVVLCPFSSCPGLERRFSTCG